MSAFVYTLLSHVFVGMFLSACNCRRVLRAFVGKPSGMDHTDLPANYTISASTL